ncbi:MAG: SRPBCC domain-containing protein [Candidatus Tyrphobacter sp.]
MHACQADANDLVITRILDAPRDLVFKAWSDPAQLAQWGGRKVSRIPLRLDMNQRFMWLMGVIVTSWITTILTALFRR